MATWMEKLFGGNGTAGFFGGGQYQVDPNAYNIGQAGEMNFGMGEGGWQDAQRYNGLYNPLGQSQDTRTQQGQLAGNLFSTLNGSQPSVAQEQLKQTTQGNVANQFAMAQANPGNPGAARMAAMNAGNMNQQAAGQGALLRAQETQNTQGLLGNVLSGMRGQDVGTYSTLQNTAQGYLGQQMQLQQMQQQAQAQRQQAQQGAFSGAQQNAVGGKILNAAAGIGGAMVGIPGMGGGGGGGGGMVNGVNPNTTMIPPQSLPSGFAQGGLIPGHAKGGDNLKNDTVPAKLSPGEIVLPRSVTKADHAPDKAKAFVEAIRKKHKLKKAA